MSEFSCFIDFKEIDQMLDGMDKQLSGASEAAAGYFGGKAYPDKEKSKGKGKSEGLEVAKNAMIQEYGTGDGRIPPRPFMTNAAKNAPKWEKIVQSEFDKGRDMAQALQRVGAEMRDDIVRAIDANIPPPNAPATVDKKGSSHTLIDTGNGLRRPAFEVK